MQIVLHEPRIPPNTGTIARLCAATNTPLHLIEPLGFKVDDKHLRRAGLDYWEHVKVQIWPDFDSFLQATPVTRLVLTSARTGTPYSEFSFVEGDILVFGSEDTGLPKDMLNAHPHHVRIPIWGKVRSLNIANAAAITLYEAFRQTDGFPVEG